MKEIGIKLADGSFYPIMEDGTPCNKKLVLTTVKDNQTRVLVDLYRSKTGTMEDAEYIDSLQIDNLVQHPNGSVELSLNIGLDENNKLSASMNDPETGASSTADVTLVSRTMEERLEPTNYEVVGGGTEPEITEDDTQFDLPEEKFSAEDVILEEEPDFDLPDEITDDEIIVENPPVEDDVSGSVAEEPENLPELEETVFDLGNDDSLDEPEIPVEDSADFADVSFDGENSSGEEPAAEETLTDEEIVPAEEDSFAADETPAEEELSDDDGHTAEIAGAAVAGAAAGGLLAKALAGNKEETEIEETADADGEPALSAEDMTVDSTADDFLPDFDEPADTTVSSESFDLPSDVNLEEEKNAAEEEFMLPDENVSEAAATEEPSSGADETPVLQNSSEPSDITEEMPSPSVTDDDFDFDLPDFTDDGGEKESESGSVGEEASFGEETPAFGGTDTDVTLQDTVSGYDATSDTTVVSDENTDDMFSSDDFSLPDFPEMEDTSGTADSTMSDDDFINTITEPEHSDASEFVKDSTPSNGIVFDGLYDKETVDGNSSASEEDFVEKKTKVPVIICVVCAIICVIATALVLFVVPSKYNLLNRHSKTLAEAVSSVQQADEELLSGQEEEPLPEPVEAKEEEIVVVTEPEVVETVVPEPPAAPETKPADITYKIKWGDTLWDIADAYYKNPWRYHLIASYNHIKDPDYIISGTTIVLPAK